MYNLCFTGSWNIKVLCTSHTQQRLEIKYSKWKTVFFSVCIFQDILNNLDCDLDDDDLMLDADVSENASLHSGMFGIDVINSHKINYGSSQGYIRAVMGDTICQNSIRFLCILSKMIHMLTNKSRTLNSSYLKLNWIKLLLNVLYQGYCKVLALALAHP